MEQQDGVGTDVVGEKVSAESPPMTLLVLLLYDSAAALQFCSFRVKYQCTMRKL